jgi:hypothetical protein
MWIVVASPRLLELASTSETTRAMREQEPPVPVQVAASRPSSSAGCTTVWSAGRRRAGALQRRACLAMLSAWAACTFERPADRGVSLVVVRRSAARGGTAALIRAHPGASSRRQPRPSQPGGPDPDRPQRRRAPPSTADHPFPGPVRPGGQRLSMADAAYAAGFGSYTQVHRMFRRLVGSSPPSTALASTPIGLGGVRHRRVRVGHRCDARPAAPRTSRACAQDGETLMKRCAWRGLTPAPDRSTEHGLHAGRHRRQDRYDASLCAQSVQQGLEHLKSRLARRYKAIRVPWWL